MEVPILQIDSFTSAPFKGNPAGVCLLEQPRPTEWMQNVGSEMNLSETAFIVPRREEDGGYDLRWFTPTNEVPLCGHATLAGAHALWEIGILAADREARFNTLSGWLVAKKNGQRIEMDFPAFLSEPSVTPEDVAKAIGIMPEKIKTSIIRRGDDTNFLLELVSAEVVRNLKPDFELLSRAVKQGVIVTARGDVNPYDFISRYFAGYVGIDEDPVTGAAHCMLTPYWAARLGKNEMLAYQASARGGEVSVSLNGDRVILGGQAVTIFKGSLFC